MAGDLLPKWCTRDTPTAFPGKGGGGGGGFVNIRSLSNCFYYGMASHRSSDSLDFHLCLHETNSRAAWFHSRSPGRLNYEQQKWQFKG
jgi:hypothetical protein